MVHTERTSTDAKRSGWFLSGARDAFSLAWLPWLIARIVTLAALALTRYEIHKFHITDTKAVATSHGGLLSWDASWYRSIAEHGYHDTGRAALRFFPLLPLLARLLHTITFVPTGGVLVVVANVCALAATMLVAHIAATELGDRDAARRAVWLFSLLPPAFAYVMGYAEATFVLLAAATLVCLRRQMWLVAAVLGLAAALTRPVGFVLAAAAIIEVARTWRAASTGSRVARAAAVVAPAAGLLAYLSWSAIAFHDFFAPVRYQRQGLPRSVSTNPVFNAGHDVSGLASGRHLGSGLHLPWIAVALALCVLVCRKLPASYAAYSIGVVALALASNNFESFERYALSAFPLVIVAASVLLRSRRVEMTVLLLSTVGLFGYAFLAFNGAYVP